MGNVDYANAGLGSVASANFSQGGYPPAQAIDGSDVTKWREYVDGASFVWWTVDLGISRFIESIRTLYQNSAVDVFKIQYSTDGITYSTLLNTTRGSGDYTDETGGVTARYWRVYMRIGGYSFSEIYSFEAWGPLVAPSPPTEADCPAISAWLDGLEAYYVPCVNNWLAAN